LRDMIDHATGGVLSRGSDAETPATFRELGSAGLAEFPPIIAISDFVVGRTLDRKPTQWELMFLPSYLRDVIHERLGAAPQLIYQRKGPPIPLEGPSDRSWSLLIGLAFSLPLGLAVATRRGVRAALVVATIPLVLMGTLIWGLAILSSIPGLRWNEAIFLFVPFDVLLPILKGASRRRYAQIRAGMIVWSSLLCAVGIFKQPLWIPIACAFVPHALIAWIEPMLAARRDSVAETVKVSAPRPAA